MSIKCGLCKGPNDRVGQRHCASCHKAYMAEWRIKQKEERNPIRDAVKRDRRIQNKYKLSPEELDATLRIQDYACAICITKFGDEHMERPRVDHDHKTGHVRGLLCHKCNVAIGLLDDQPRFFDLAAQYLRTRSAARLINPNTKPKTTMASILERISGVESA